METHPTSRMRVVEAVGYFWNRPNRCMVKRQRQNYEITHLVTGHAYDVFHIFHL